MITKILKLQGMHCVSCSMLIEGELEDMGVQAKANYAKQLVEVTYDPKKIKEESIVGAIQKLGYQVKE
jgi:copper chaperone CopZ